MEEGQPGAFCRHGCIASLRGHENQRLGGNVPTVQPTVYRHAKRKIGDKEPEDRRKYNKGRPHVMSMRDQRLRVTFTVARLTLEVGLLGKVALRIVRKISTRAATSTSKCGRKADL